MSATQDLPSTDFAFYSRFTAPGGGQVTYGQITNDFVSYLPNVSIDIAEAEPDVRNDPQILGLLLLRDDDGRIVPDNTYVQRCQQFYSRLKRLWENADARQDPNRCGATDYDDEACDSTPTPTGFFCDAHAQAFLRLNASFEPAALELLRRLEGAEMLAAEFRRHGWTIATFERWRNFGST